MQLAVDYVGKLSLIQDIGLVDCPATSDLMWVEARDFRSFPPKRRPNSHKGSYGHAVIIAGSVGYHGAAVLSAEAATRACPGLISVHTHPDCYIPIAAQLKAPMVHPWTGDQALPEKGTAILLGPGLANPDLPDSVKEFVRRTWGESPLTVVADASALDWLPTGPCPANALRVITPHPGEAGRMLGVRSSEIQHDRVKAVRELSRKFGNCLVVLKGHQTLVGRAQGHVTVNSTGNAWLAQGGSGDVLAGFMVGLLAQPELARDPERCVRYAVWAHGQQAENKAHLNRPIRMDDLLSSLGFELQFGTPEAEL